MDRLLSDPYEHLSHLKLLYDNPLKYDDLDSFVVSDLSRHLALDFKALSLCISEDVYEWNHAIFTFLCWIRSSVSSPGDAKGNLNLADFLLELDLLRDEPVDVLEREFLRVFMLMKSFVFSTNDLCVLNRYDLICRVSSSKYRVNNDLLMLFSCYFVLVPRSFSQYLWFVS